MYGEPAVIRHLACTLRDQAADIRAEADTLVGRADGVHWTGLAADAMRHRGRDRACDLRACAGRHDDAADALVAHAREVERRQELIAGAEHRFRDLAQGARHRLTELADSVDQALDRWVHHIVPPAAGSKDWLDLEIPSGS